jgi:hypothetical protein
MSLRLGKRLRIEFARRSNGSFVLTVEWHRVTPADRYHGLQPFCRGRFLYYTTCLPFPATPDCLLHRPICRLAAILFRRPFRCSGLGLMCAWC